MNTEVRTAHRDDVAAVEALVARTDHVSHLSCWREYLTDGCFILVEQRGFVVGAFLASPDESPVAWVRLAAVDDALDIDEWLDLVLPPVLESLRSRGARRLAWMDVHSWVSSYLSAHGFRPLTEVITLVKSDRNTPDVIAVDVHLRSASDGDIPAIVAVDRAAFTPYWWRSEATIRRRAGRTSLFTVAERAGEVIGYTEREPRLPSAHLNRIAVRPTDQERRVGATLLRHTLRALWRSGVEQVTLNTQRDNRSSRRLYDRFGFEPTDDVATVWTSTL